MNYALIILLFLSLPYKYGFTKIPNNLDPKLTCSILENEGFATKGYMKDYPESNDYFCASSYKTYDFNNIAFYAIGNANVINKIELTVNINNLKTEKRELKNFQNYCSILLKKISIKEIPNNLVESINYSKTTKVKVNGFELELKKELFPSKKGYRLTLSII